MHIPSLNHTCKIFYSEGGVGLRGSFFPGGSPFYRTFAFTERQSKIGKV